jgi:hypothetical protein
MTFDNDEEYNFLKTKVLRDADAFKAKHKDILGYRTGKMLKELTLLDLIQQGFSSPNLTRKHAEEIFEGNKNENTKH